MSKNNKGFALIETLIASTVVATILIYVFIQLNSIQSKYDNSFKYNDVDDIYRLSNIEDYINSLPKDSKNTIISKIKSDSKILISYENNNYKNIEYIDNRDIMLEDLDIKNLVITNYDIDNIKTNDLSGNIKKILKKIDSDGNNYRLIAEFNNGNIATIQLNMEGV